MKKQSVEGDFKLDIVFWISFVCRQYIIPLNCHIKGISFNMAAHLPSRLYIHFIKIQHTYTKSNTDIK